MDEVLERGWGQKRWLVMPPEVRREIIALTAQGKTRREVLEEVDVSVGSYLNVVMPLGGVIRPEQATQPSDARLSIEDRIEIRRGLDRGGSYHQIGETLSPPRHKSTVCREVNANGGKVDYAPTAAHRRAWTLARRSKPTKLGTNPMLCAKVVAGLKRLWSPAQIAAKLGEAFGEDSSMTVSHETIYKSLYVQGRGELRTELTGCLRTGRAVRKRRGRTDTRGKIADMVMISERPAEVTDRAVPGHWEGDLIIGTNGKSAVGTLVERTSRFVVLLALDGDRRAETVRDAMTTAITQLPESLRRSVTWDQGVEMAEHVQFTVDTDVPVYFCDPHSPWQRGTNENTNGLLRQYMPKGTDLSVHTPEDLQGFADSLNTRPRKTLGWKSPAETLAQIVATTG